MWITAKMGRGIKVLFCSLCLDRSPDRHTNHQSIDHGIDVSHLATPHNSFNLATSNIRASANSTPICEQASNEDDNNNYSQQHHYNTPTITNHSLLSANRASPDQLDGRDNSTPSVHDRQQHPCDNNQSLPSPHSSSSQSNIYEQSQDEPQQLDNNDNIQQQQPHELHYNHDQEDQNVPNMHNTNNGTSTKLSYDIISVREPLAKILAERQLLHQAQHQQRQILGDHEYIEVYGERGSSCFYEEIAGSTTSSATYDQIGNVSNHNYQALINAYAVTNRVTNRDLTNENVISNRTRHDVDNSDNIYNLTQSTNTNTNQSQKLSDDTNLIPTTSYMPFDTTFEQNESPAHPIMSSTSESMPVYSVINKATRKGNATTRSTMEESRPPPPLPPPKNSLATSQQPSTSAIPHYQQSSLLTNNRANPARIPSPSMFKNNVDNSDRVDGELREVEKTDAIRVPQPPPRYTKNSMFDTTKRPLPLPDNYQILHSNNNSTLARDEDLESLNNGYEMLTNVNFNEDVGYEKIRETHPYSCGSISSQFHQFHPMDHEGYESVQPIYSSPSNALVEPNYEAIGPTTASELAAAAAARLNAAVAVREYLKQDQP